VRMFLDDIELLDATEGSLETGNPVGLMLVDAIPNFQGDEILSVKLDQEYLSGKCLSLERFRWEQNILREAEKQRKQLAQIHAQEMNEEAARNQANARMGDPDAWGSNVQTQRQARSAPVPSNENVFSSLSDGPSSAQFAPVTVLDW